MANPAPGFKTRPDHTITLKPAHARISVGGTEVAESTSAILMSEHRYPPRAYVPREAITATLEPSQKTTHCPFKGDTVYFHVTLGGETFKDAAWAYNTPFDEMRDIAGLIAFDDRFEVAVL
ncbi:MAG: DUF427 domain-containing protein [Pseudomonadota bacterium]